MTTPATDASSSPFAPGENFAGRYCRWRGIDRADYTEAVLAETLYPHARLLRPLLRDHAFAPDRLFVDNVGRIRRRREFNNLMLDFTEAYENHGWLRDSFHLRVSVQRMHALVWHVFALPAEPSAGSRAPVPPLPGTAHLSG